MSVGDLGSVLATLEFDTGTGANPQLIHVVGDIFAIAYTGPDGDGFLKTVVVERDGTIAAAVTATLEFDAAQGSQPQIVHMGGTLYAISYAGAVNDQWIATVDIFPDGTISAVVDSLEMDASDGLNSSMVKITATVVAIAYKGP
ncbi:MAG: hypothetical protein J3T61_04605, partial [Candidatus Brocadiales bacterium]|nr:hypothetical protein [Candidatus Bathyanammoxibius sp.]